MQRCHTSLTSRCISDKSVKGLMISSKLSSKSACRTRTQSCGLTERGRTILHTTAGQSLTSLHIRPFPRLLDAPTLSLNRQAIGSDKPQCCHMPGNQNKLGKGWIWQPCDSHNILNRCKHYFSPQMHRMRIPDRSIIIVTRLGFEDRDSILDRAQFLSSSQCPDRVWGPPHSYPMSTSDVNWSLYKLSYSPAYVARLKIHKALPLLHTSAQRGTWFEEQSIYFCSLYSDALSASKSIQPTVK